MLKTLAAGCLAGCFLATPAMADIAPYVGTTEHGGAYGFGSVISAVNGRIETLYSFCPNGEGHCADGANPVGGAVVLPDGSIVGTTARGGRGGSGTIFQLTASPAGWKYQVIWNVCWAYNDCAYAGTARGTLQYAGTDKDGNFVVEGTCEKKSGRGVFYRLTFTADDGQRIVALRYLKARHG